MTTKVLIRSAALKERFIGEARNAEVRHHLSGFGNLTLAIDDRVGLAAAFDLIEGGITIARGDHTSRKWYQRLIRMYPSIPEQDVLWREPHDAGQTATTVQKKRLIDVATEGRSDMLTVVISAALFDTDLLTDEELHKLARVL